MFEKYSENGTQAIECIKALVFTTLTGNRVESLILTFMC